jgi:hypothetical protein
MTAEDWATKARNLESVGGFRDFVAKVTKWGSLIHRAGSGSAHIAAGTAGPGRRRFSARGGLRPHGEGRERLVEAAALTCGTCRFAICPGEMLEVVAAGVARVFENWHEVL